MSERSGQIDPADPVTDTLAVYDADADAYAERYLHWSLPPWGMDLVLLATEGLVPGARVLDVGCGPGRDLALIREAGFDAIGVDGSVELARRARRFGPVVEADMRALPFETASIDAILASASLFHLPHGDGAVALAEFHRVLKPGGRLTLSVKEGDGQQVDDDGRFFQLYTETELDGTLSGAGFTVTTRERSVDARLPNPFVWLVRVATS